MVARLCLSLALPVILAGSSALAPVPPRSCHKGPSPAIFPSGNLRPYIVCQSFNGPKWTPIDFHLVSIPVGDEDSGFGEFFDSINTILPGPYHAPHPQLGVGPGDPHPGPYNYEMAWGVYDSGYFEGRDLRLSQFRSGNGACLCWNLVPNGARGMPADEGSSPDFASGPIISNSLFPIILDEVTTLNGQLFSAPIVGAVIPALNMDLTPPFDVDGHSHTPNFLFDSAEFSTTPRTPVELIGVYRYAIRLTDKEGRGWNIDCRFTVVQPYQ